MSLHIFFKGLFNTNSQNIAKHSTAEIAFNSWKKTKENEKEDLDYLNEIYINNHHKPRIDKDIEYTTYKDMNLELFNNYYKTQKTEYLNKIITAERPAILTEKPTKFSQTQDIPIYTKYSLPNTTINMVSDINVISNQ